MDGDFVVQLSPMSDILAEGMDYTNYDSWCQSPRGGDFVKEKVISVVVPEGSVLFIPYGFLWTATHLSVVKAFVEGDDDADSDTENHALKSALYDETLCNAIVFPMFSKTWVSAIAEDVCTCIKSMNAATFAIKRAKPMWAERATIFKKLFET